MGINLGSHKIITKEIFRINFYRLIKKTQLTKGLRKEVDRLNLLEESGNIYDRLEDLLFTTGINISCYTHTSLGFLTISVILSRYNLFIHLTISEYKKHIIKIRICEGNYSSEFNEKLLNTIVDKLKYLVDSGRFKYIEVSHNTSSEFKIAYGENSYT